MDFRDHIRKLNPSSTIRGALPPIVLSVIFLSLSPNTISVFQCFLATVLLESSWLAYRNWKRRRTVELPLFAIIALMYWVYYALPLFWGARTISGVATISEQEVSPESITMSLELAALGVGMLWLGMKVGIGRRLAGIRFPRLRKGPAIKHYLRLLLVAGAVLGFQESFPSLLGEGGRQMLTIAASVVPLVAFILLFRSYIRGECSHLDKLLVLAFLGFRFVTGLASGWLGAFASIILVCVAVYVSERKKIPTWAVILIVAFTLFFQIGKKEFRTTYWRAEIQTSQIDRVTFWTETSLNKWSEALADSSGETLREALNYSLARVSLLTQTANVVDLTPTVVPYQYFRLYSYMGVTWIPRFIWPDKPSANEANQFYQLAYGLSTEDSLENVSMAVGMMTEGYISFGWSGVVGVMFLMGIFLDIFQNVFFGKKSGSLMMAIGIALLPQIIAVESQVSVYIGGTIQQVLFILLVMLPILQLRNPTRSLAFRNLTPRVSN